MNRERLAMEVALLRIATYPRSRSDELTIEQAREIARAAIAYGRIGDAERSCADGCNGCDDCTDYEP